MTTALDPWVDVVGQPQAVECLRSTVANPVHSYLFVGPPGSGRRSAARAFAAELFAASAADPEDAERQARLALEGKHADLVEVEPEGERLRMEDEIPRVITEASRSPVEAAHKVIVLGEYHRMDTQVGALLKTIEEPPPRTIFVIVADEVPPELVTTASRALRVDFGPVPTAAIVERLETEGVDRAHAVDAAEAAGGDLARARLLATDPDLVERRAAWRSVPDRLNGTGAAVVATVADLRRRIDAAQSPLDQRQAKEAAELEAEVERYGLRKSVLKDQERHHRRAARRFRAQELRFGLAVLAGRYRDELATSPDPAPLVEALGAIHQTADDLVRNPTEDLALLGLVLKLPRLR